MWSVCEGISDLIAQPHFPTPDGTLGCSPFTLSWQLLLQGCTFTSEAGFLFFLEKTDINTYFLIAFDAMFLLAFAFFANFDKKLLA